MAGHAGQVHAGAYPTSAAPAPRALPASAPASLEAATVAATARASASDAAPDPSPAVAGFGVASAQRPHYRPRGLKPTPAARPLAGPTVHQLLYQYVSNVAVCLAVPAAAQPRLLLP